jgi:hypothetical protein
MKPTAMMRRRAQDVARWRRHFGWRPGSLRPELAVSAYGGDAAAWDRSDWRPLRPDQRRHCGYWTTEEVAP